MTWDDFIEPTFLMPVVSPPSMQQTLSPTFQEVGSSNRLEAQSPKESMTNKPRDEVTKTYTKGKRILFSPSKHHHDQQGMADLPI